VASGLWLVSFAVACGFFLWLVASSGYNLCVAKKSVKISLATKFRILFGTSVLGIIAAALVVPWYFMERLADQNVEPTARELTRVRLNEWTRSHFRPGPRSSVLEECYSAGGELEGRKGPTFIKTKRPPESRLRGTRDDAMSTFIRRPDQDLAIYRDDTERGTLVYRVFRAVRVDNTCTAAQCHGSAAPAARQFQVGELVGMVDVAVPESSASGPLVWWTRGALLVGGGLAAFLAVVLFAVITHRLILRPVRQLRQVADKVTEGDMSVRSPIATGDELQRLGESFNEMLEAIQGQHEQLRQANRALDIKLSELAEANVSLFEANRVKNEFLANVSHELRTPLNSIIGFADLLADAENDRIRRYGENISSSSKRLLSMINDLLDIAKIEAGKSHVRWDRVSVMDTCQTLLALMQPLADKKQLNVDSKLDAAVPIITTDPSKFQQVLYNLLSNAIKFTPPGGNVTVIIGTVPPANENDGQGEVFISVADTGPGIAESDQPRIFEKFYQVDRPLTKESSGTGLGLAIAKELTAIIGGRLTLQSLPGQGATFTLHLPVEPKTV